MLIYLLYSRPEAQRPRAEPYIELYRDAARRLGVTLELHFVEDFVPGYSGPVFGGAAPCGIDLPALLPDAVIFRTVHVPLSYALEARGVRCFNSARTAELCNDKAKTLEAVKALGVPTLAYDLGVSGEVCPRELPCVVKPLHGSGGRDVLLARDEAEYQAAAERLRGQPFMVQELCGQPGRDVRVYVLGKKILTAMERVSGGDFRSNYNLGGTAQLYTLSKAERTLVERVTAGFDLGLCGVDFLFHQGGWVLNEMEDVVGSRMVYDFTDIQVVWEYMRWILQQV